MSAVYRVLWLGPPHPRPPDHAAGARLMLANVEFADADASVSLNDFHVVIAAGERLAQLQLGRFPAVRGVVSLGAAPGFDEWARTRGLLAEIIRIEGDPAGVAGAAVTDALARIFRRLEAFDVIGDAWEGT